MSLFKGTSTTQGHRYKRHMGVMRIRLWWAMKGVEGIELYEMEKSPNWALCLLCLLHIVYLIWCPQRLCPILLSSPQSLTWFAWCSNKKRRLSMYCPHMVHIHLGIHVVVVGSEMRLLRIGKQAKRRLISFSVSMCVFPFPGFLLGMLPAVAGSFLHHRAVGGRGWGPVSV